MAASAATVYHLAYTKAIGQPEATLLSEDDIKYCGMGLDIDEIRQLFYSRGWNPAYNHQAWQRCLAVWEDFENIVRVRRIIFFKPKECDRTTCALKIERAMPPETDVVAII